MRYESDNIYKVIPNRYPLMLLETLDVEDDKATSIINLTGHEWFFKCHYPGYPVMPLSLLIECLSQTFSSIFLQKEQTTEIPVFSSIGSEGKIVLKDKLVPGDKLTMIATLNSFRRGIAKGTCKAFKNDQEKPILEFDIVECLPSQMIRM